MLFRSPGFAFAAEHTVKNIFVKSKFIIGSDDGTETYDVFLILLFKVRERAKALLSLLPPAEW